MDFQNVQQVRTGLWPLDDRRDHAEWLDKRANEEELNGNVNNKIEKTA